MAKSTCLLALFVAIVVCAEAIRIDPVQPTSRPGKYFPDIKRDDPRCNNRRGMFPDTTDCTKYIKCVDGNSRIMKCPDNFKFDTIRHCIPPNENPDCGKDVSHGPLDEKEKCPATYGIFPSKFDCHKYISCNDGIPTVKECPDKHVYSDTNGACVSGDKCPDQQTEEESVCKRSNQLLPDEKNCRRYIKCVNFRPLKKECLPGTAFDPERRRCTKEQLEKCKNNDILNVGQDE